MIGVTDLHSEGDHHEEDHHAPPALATKRCCTNAGLNDKWMLLTRAALRPVLLDGFAYLKNVDAGKLPVPMVPANTTVWNLPRIKKFWTRCVVDAVNKTWKVSNTEMLWWAVVEHAKSLVTTDLASTQLDDVPFVDGRCEKVSQTRTSDKLQKVFALVPPGKDCWPAGDDLLAGTGGGSEGESGSGGAGEGTLFTFQKDLVGAETCRYES